MSNDAGTFPSFPFARPAANAPPCEYARLRREAPVSRVTLWDGSTPWLVVQHEAVRQILANGDGNGRWSKDRRRPGFPEMTATGKAASKSEPTFVYMDEPERMRDRQIIDRIFSRENVEKTSPGIVEITVDSLLHILQERIHQGPADFYDVFAMRVPTFVIFSLLGAPVEDLNSLTDYNAIQLKGTSTATEVSSANKKLLDYTSDLLERRAVEPRGDLISDIVSNEIRPGHLDKSTALHLLFPMLVTATITNLICYGLIILDQHPEQLADLKADPSLAKAFVEELCRFHTSSAIASFRVATEDSYVDGKLIYAGEAVLLSNQSANRDEDVFPEPNEFNMHRKRGTEEALAFGYGPRRCPVEWLVREQLETVFRLLFKRLPDIKLAVPATEIKWLPPTGVVGVSELLVRC